MKTLPRDSSPFSQKPASASLLKAGSWLFAASMVTNVFNYAFQVGMGRLLIPAQFALLSACLSVSVILSAPVATLLMALSRETAKLRAKNNFAAIRRLLHLVNVRVLAFGVLGLAVFGASSSLIQDYLRAPSILPVLILGLCIFSGLAAPINVAILQGLQDYLWLGMNAGLGGPLKFLFCVGLVWAGFGVSGALFGFFLTNLSLWLLAYWPIRRHMAGVTLSLGTTPSIPWISILPIFLANLAFTVITQADMVLVNRYFPAHDAGLYAAAAVLGRSVMYAPGAFVLALFPMVSAHQARNKSARPLLV